MRYRHDFGLLDEPQKEAIRTTMKQLWEEVVGLGFYKEDKSLRKQLTSLQWFWNQIALKLSAEQAGEFLNFFQLAKEMEKEQRITAQMDMFNHINGMDYGTDYLNRRDAAIKYAEDYPT